MELSGAVHGGLIVLQAKQLTDLPQINLAVVQSLKSGVYVNIIGGAFSQCAFLLSSCRGCCT